MLNTGTDGQPCSNRSSICHMRFAFVCCYCRFCLGLFGMVDGAAADPTADVEGLDVQAKVALLAKLAFGATVSSESVMVFHFGKAYIIASL